MQNPWSIRLLVALCLSTITAAASAEGGTQLSFFIVGDAHIGWTNPDQPSLAQQRAAMGTILSAFPSLDFFMDAGDNTHPDQDVQGALDTMRRNWISVEPNACVGLPFFYTAGNHEVMRWRESDPETQCAVLGSLPCRPYYSITRKGIHIIVLPEFIRPVFLTGELLDWLRLDLAVHKDLTTIIATHNSILNTTGNDAPGYRGLAQSPELLVLFQSNPQVVAWMHGHNHDYAVVSRNNMLFVSVGRLGGFASRGACPLGGMLVEVTATGIRARGLNAETGKFLEGTHGNLNQLPVSGSLSRPTSFAARAKSEVCFGVGRDQNGAKMPVYDHFAGGTATAHLAPKKSTTLNDNPDFSLYAVREDAKRVDRQLFGYGFRLPGERRQDGLTVAPGALVMALDDRPGVLLAPNLAQATGYYRAVPGKPYRVTVELTAPAAGGTLELTLISGAGDAAPDAAKPIAQERFQLPPGRGTYSVTGVAKSSAKTIYTDPVSDIAATILAQATIQGIKSVTVHTFVIARADDTTAESPALNVGGQRFVAKSMPGGWWSAELGSALRGSRTVIETVTGGCSSWLISKCDVDWQVRNAAVADNDKSLVVEAIRNPWGGAEILIAPLFDTAEPYLAKTTGVRSMEVFPLNRGNRTLRVNVKDAADGASLVVKCATKPRSVKGALQWDYRDGFVVASLKDHSTIEVEQ